MREQGSHTLTPGYNMLFQAKQKRAEIQMESVHLVSNVVSQSVVYLPVVLMTGKDQSSSTYLPQGRGGAFKLAITQQLTKHKPWTTISCGVLLLLNCQQDQNNKKKTE